LTTIGKYAFRQCSKITTIKLSNNVSSVGYEAFYSCSSLVEFTYNNDELIPSKFLSPKFITKIYVGENVTKFKSYSFEDLHNLQKVEFLSSNNIDFKSIGASAFNNCYNLEAFSIPEHVNELSEGVFSCCYKLSRIKIPKEITQIPSSAFSYCLSLTEVNLENESTTIDQSAFLHCQNLNKINSQNIESLSSSAFEYCTSLDTFDAQRIEYIPDSCFAFCFNLKTVNFNSSNCYEIDMYAFKHTKIQEIPSNISKIRQFAFYNTSIEHLNIPNMVDGSIGNNAFSSCSKLTSVKFEQDQFSTLNLDSFIFSNCGKLETVDYCKYFTSIPSYMFYNDYSLTTINYIDSVLSIYEYAFSGCNEIRFEFNHKMVLSSYSFQNCSASTFTNIPYLSSIPDYAFAFSKVPETLSFSGTAISIGDFAFFYSTGIKELIIDGLFSISTDAFAMSSVETISFTVYSNSTISKCAFANCESLKTVSCDYKISNEILVITINDKAFENCTKLSEFDFSKANFSLGDYVFNNTQLKSIRLSRSQWDFNPLSFEGAKVESISVEENNVRSFVCRDNTLSISVDGFDFFMYYPPYRKGSEYTLYNPTNTIGPYAFYNCKYLKTLSNDPKDHIYGLLGLSFYGSSITSLTLNGFMITPYIITEFFYGMNNLQKLTLDCKNFSVSEIRKRAFYNCYSLQELNINFDYIESIGEYAFYNCSKLTKLSFPKASQVNESAFQNCNSLTELSLPYAFEFEKQFLANTNIKTFKFENPIDAIPKGAFLNCSKLTTVTLLEGLTTISSEAFSGCTSLKSITLPNSLTTIRQKSFYGCTQLNTLTIPPHVTSISSLAFAKAKLNLIINPNNGKYSIYKKALIQDGNKLHSLIGNVESSYVVPYFIKEILSGFNNLETVRYLSLPETFEFSGDLNLVEYEETNDTTDQQELLNYKKKFPLSLCYSRKNITYSSTYQGNGYINNLLLPQAYRFFDWEKLEPSDYITYKEVSSCPSTYSTDTLYDELKAVFEEDGKTFSQTQIYIGAGIFILIFILLIVFIILFIIQKRSSKSNIEDSDNSVVRAPII